MRNPAAAPCWDYNAYDVMPPLVSELRPRRSHRRPAFRLWLTLALFLLICFIAGFFLDWISILLIFIPVFIPLVRGFGFDPAWFCILFLIIIQTSYLTPPMAPAIFYLRGISPPQITLGHMFRGVVPFIILQLITLLIVMAFPATVLWLPSKLLGFG